MDSRTASLTSTDSFGLRAQQGEAGRTLLWLGVLATVLVTTVIRRALGGAVMSDPLVFWPTLGVLGAALAGHGLLLRVLIRANRAGTLLRGTWWRWVAASDVAVATALLGILAWHSARGPVAALSAPALLLLPLVVLLSILRLRPRLTLAIGLLGAAAHAVLVVRAIVVTDTAAEYWPLLATYPVLLALTASAASFVCGQVRRHVQESIAEAEARSAADRRLDSLRHDMTIAQTIQRGLLPTAPPAFAGFDVAGMSRPADLTGGDYYDWQVLPDGRLLAVIADVSGHGIGPALVMAICRAYARASLGLVDTPAGLLLRLNELLHADLPSDRFITLVIAVVEPGGRVELLSAGHGPTFLYRAADRRVEHFGGDGPPLGVLPGDAFDPPRSFTLEPGDALVMLTDGLYEWHRASDGQQFGIARLADAVVASAGGDAKAIVRELDAAATAFAAGTAQQDDITAVVLKRVG
jgi:serine phosphatase RsbU (regulator of sigma subunit)